MTPDARIVELRGHLAARLKDAEDIAQALADDLEAHSLDPETPATVTNRLTGATGEPVTAAQIQHG